MKRFAFLVLCIITGICTNAQEKFKTIEEVKAASEKINGIYIPRDTEDAINLLDTLLTSAEKEKLRALPYKDYSACLHHGLGMMIRNSWGLWSGSRLHSYFVSYGMYHPDDISSYILLAFYHHLNGTEYPRIEDIELSTNSRKVTIFSRHWWRSKAIYKNDIREFKKSGYKKGVEVYYKYPYGFSTEKEESIYYNAENLEMKAKGVIRKFDKKRGCVLIKIEHTPEPYGIIIYDGNQVQSKDSCRNYATFTSESPSIFLLQEGETMWFTLEEFEYYWY